MLQYVYSNCDLTDMNYIMDNVCICIGLDLKDALICLCVMHDMYMCMSELPQTFFSGR